MNGLNTKVSKIFWITICWTILSVARFFFAYITLLQDFCDLTGISVTAHLIGSILVGVLAGIMGGSTIVFLWEGWLRTMTYRNALLSIFFTYNIVFFLVAVCSRAYQAGSNLGSSFDGQHIFSVLYQQFINLESIESYFFWMSVVLSTLIILQVSDKYGPGVFMSFILGRYFHPKREERIFMFLDLRSSTSIAEQLGEEQYFNFLKESFMSITDAILNAKGEIYQYVGDEVVVSWPIKRNEFSGKCISCFFDITSALKNKAPEFNRKYNVVPEFKAGFHYGYVMAGEIGVVKRDIVFTGDVLNTTARIQSKCNEMGVNVLSSKALLDKMPWISKNYVVRSLGDFDLRGKEEDVVLCTVEEI